MTKRTWNQWGVTAMALTGVAVLCVWGGRLAAEQSAGEAGDPNGTQASATPATDERQQGVVQVGRLIYGGGKSGACFADGFITTVARETRTNVERQFRGVDAGSEDLFRYPFVVMTGEGAFTLTDQEVENLRAYLNRGGFILASAGCSNSDWASSFRRSIARIMPDQAIKPLESDHPVFRTLYRIERVLPRKATSETAMYGLSVGDRLAVVFSPLGLNDTGAAGDGCCCCGGNEISNAQQINANILVYALTH